MRNELVKVKFDKVVCDSKTLADNFGKRHKDVLDSIRHLLPLEAKTGSYMFIWQRYLNLNNGHLYPVYWMTKDGFTLLVTGFKPTENNREWAAKYFKAFNETEKHEQEKERSNKALEWAYSQV